MTMTDLRPPVQTVGARATAILAAIKADDGLVDSTSLYASCWSTFTGYPSVANFDPDTDTTPLLEEALRVLALKSAGFELTDDETAGELLVSAPVDEMGPRRAPPAHPRRAAAAVPPSHHGRLVAAFAAHRAGRGVRRR